jgi:hypothetical protein
LLTVTFTSITNESIARSCPIHEYSTDRFASDAYRILKQFNRSSTMPNTYSPALIHLGIGAGKFLDYVQTKSIVDLFTKSTNKNDVPMSIESTINSMNTIDEIDHDENTLDTIIPIEQPSNLRGGDFFDKFQRAESTSRELSTIERKPSSSIASFFSRYTTHETNDSPLQVDEDYITCTKCHKSILAWNMSEHEDFHFARQLQMEENRSHSNVTTSQHTNVKQSKISKRKNDTSSTSNNRTLDAFLNKKPKI